MRAAFRLAFVSIALSLGTACGEEPSGSLPDSGVLPADVGPLSDGGPGPGDAEVPAMATVSPTTLDFGVVRAGTSAMRTFTITAGSTAASIAVAQPSGRDAALFSRAISVPDVEGAFELAAGASAEVTVTLSPDEAGVAFARVELMVCANPVCAVVVELIGEAVDSGVECGAVVELGAAFPGTCVSGQATCTNVAESPESITAVALETGSDPQITVTPPALPVELAGGASLTIELAFCPDVAGDFSGSLLITAAVERRVVVRGHGGGANITCDPAMVDFGAFGVNTTVARNIACFNDGFEDGYVSAITVSGAFQVDRTAFTVPAGGFEVFEVSTTAAQAGAYTGRLELSTNDLDSPLITIELAAEALDVAPCSAQLVPPFLDFGLVGLGEARRGSIAVENTGTEPCLVLSTAVSYFGPGFSVENEPGGFIDPGARAPIDFVFAPAVAGTSTVTVEVSFGNPSTPPLVAAAIAVAGDAPLTVSPAVIDFGAVPAGCAAPPTRALELRALSTTAVTGVELAGTSSASFAIGGLPGLPAILPRLGTIDLTVTFTGTSPGVYTAALRVTVAGQLQPIVVQLVASIGAAATHTQIADLGAPQLDVLFMVDDSASMPEAQAALAAAVPRLTGPMIARAADFHVAVVTSDMIDAAKSGRLQGTPPVIDAAASPLDDVLSARVQPGTDGDGVTESGVAALVAALSPPLVTNENAGFLRPGAHLVIIALTDEDDHSQGSITDAAVVLRAAATGGVSFYAITGQTAGTCNGPHGSASAAPRWHELVARLEGVHLSFCAPMEDAIDRVARDLFALSVPLESDPRTDTIAVSPASTWTYDRISNSVVFDPAPSGPVTISYEAYCASATCGDGVIDAIESCDDMNADDTDACTAGCRPALCGDGFTQAGVEPCDDANADNDDDCVGACVAPACGDGFVRAGVEDCDDGNTTSGDGCPATCLIQRDLTGWYTVDGPTAATYTALANETPIVLTGGDDDGVGTVPLPFAFNLFGAPVTSLDVSPNGLVAASGLTDANSFTNTSFPDGADPQGVIAVWWDDLLLDANVTGGASLAYEVLGAAPDRVLVIQWRGIRVVNHTTNNHRRFNFQLALFETTNVVELRYGETQTSGAVPTATNASAGIENADASVGQDLLTCTPSCAGPARPANPNGFPRASRITLTP